jgi:hypothetical protein
VRGAKSGLRASPPHQKIAKIVSRAPTPGWDAAAERRDAQDGFHSAAQAGVWAGGDFDADRGFILKLEVAS